MTRTIQRITARRADASRFGGRVIAAISLGLAVAAMAVVGCRSATTPAESVATAEAPSAPRSEPAPADAPATKSAPLSSVAWYAESAAVAADAETRNALPPGSGSAAPAPSPDARLGLQTGRARGTESLRRGAFGGGGGLVAERDAAAEQASQVPVIRGPFDEVWVIARDRDAIGAPQDDEIPGIGSLGCVVPGSPPIPMPLLASDYRVRVRGPIAETTCTQRFRNTFSEPVEAIYVFPLPHRAAVADFVLAVGDRRIRGIVRDRAEAEQIYREAKEAGFTASLLREDRPNVFTEKIANLPPQVPVDVELTWFEALGYDAGSHELSLPLV
ncbi:MAG: VIT domain-containing protein, partial [Phycisphaerales bacterium]